MSSIQIYINKLIANYSSSCNFKIKVIFSTSPYRESAENKHSFKYEKGSSEINIYEILNLKPFHPLTSEDKLQFFLEVYTRTGYKTAGVGVLNLARGITSNEVIKIEIKKCPLGKGYLELHFLNFNLKPSSTYKKKVFQIKGKFLTIKFQVILILIPIPIIYMIKALFQILAIQQI